MTHQNSTILKHRPRHRPPAALRRGELGLSLLQVMLFVMVLAGLAAVGYMQWLTRQAEQTSTQEVRSLTQADTAIKTFATVMHRLPCPDVNRDGLEDCAATDQKGWLPSVSLRLAGADSGVGIGQLRYLVQRGGGAFDLTVLTDSWRPVEYNGTTGTFDNMLSTTAGGGTYQANILTLTDLCQRLRTGESQVATAAMASVLSAPVRPVAYALAHPGVEDDDGNGDLFDGTNGNVNARFEDPQRSHTLASYDDIVFERSYASLRSHFRCDTLTNSIDTVALGLDVVSQVDDIRERHIGDAEQAIIFAAIGAAITAMELAAAIAEAASDSGNAAAEFATCAASLGLAVNACAAAPQHVATAIAAGASAYLQIASIALNITAAIKAGEALALANNSVTPGEIPCDPADVTDAMNAAKEDWDKQIANVAKVEGELAALITQYNNANARRTSNINSIYAAARLGGTSSAIDGYVTAVIAAAGGYSDASAAYEAARLETQYNSESLQNWRDTVSDYEYKIANREATLAAKEARLAQVNALLDPFVCTLPLGLGCDDLQDDLEQEQFILEGEIQELQDVETLEAGLAEAEKKVTEFEAGLAAAQTAEAAALTANNNARTGYATAYSTLIAQSYGPYNTTHSSGTIVACTPVIGQPACPTGSAQSSGNVAYWLAELFGTRQDFPPFVFYQRVDNGAGQPGTDSVYLFPEKIQQQIDAKEEELEEARELRDKAKLNYDRLKEKNDSPDPCNITGSGVDPLSPTTINSLLINTDLKGGTR
ncbi:hypothetical protein [Hydrogenophaga sp. 5NK40-0174]|uniref:hypothetical protein n=1 Tax=Hydrogenophaga sp. 5NK40-0174 TaxID=3127649 RepID=UPI00310A2042